MTMALLMEARGSKKNCFVGWNLALPPEIPLIPVSPFPAGSPSAPAAQIKKNKCPFVLYFLINIVFHGRYGQKADMTVVCLLMGAVLKQFE